MNIVNAPRPNCAEVSTIGLIDEPLSVDTLWYFLGFRYGDVEWLPSLLEAEQPECTVLLCAWGTPTIEKDFEDKAQEFNKDLADPKFELESAGGSDHRFLLRRRPLKDFLGAEDQFGKICGFFREAHARIKSFVPLALDRHLKLRSGRDQFGPGL